MHAAIGLDYARPDALRIYVREWYEDTVTEFEGLRGRWMIFSAGADGAAPPVRIYDIAIRGMHITMLR